MFVSNKVHWDVSALQVWLEKGWMENAKRKSTLIKAVLF